MIILKDGTYYEPSDEQIIKWQRAYEKIDVHKELEAIANRDRDWETPFSFPNA